MSKKQVQRCTNSAV